MKMTKKNVVQVIIGLYIVATAGYIGYRMWQDFIDRYSTQAYALGKADTIQAIVSQASDGSCKPVTVYNSTEQVQLIDTTCLTTTAADTATDSTTNTNSQ